MEIKTIKDMKQKFFTFAALIASLLVSGNAAAQDYKGNDPLGTVSYCLPQTSLSFEVEAVQEKFYAGPYAKYASKYLGVEAKEADKTSYQLVSVKMTPYVEADQSKRYLLEVGTKPATASFLQMTSQGLISVTDGVFGESSIWRFPTASEGDFSDKGVSSNLTSESATLYHKTKEGSAYNKVAVQQNVVVEKSLEKRAAETAATIFSLREKRIQIVTGDTDATYSGEAMAAAVAELTRLEQEYLTLFMGYSEYKTQKMNFDVLPQAGDVQKYIAFRISDTDGLVPADNISGKPVLMELVPQAIMPADAVNAKGAKTPSVYYRVPAICTLKLLNGTNLVLQSRVAVYQLGVESSFPVNLQVK